MIARNSHMKSIVLFVLVLVAVVGVFSQEEPERTLLVSSCTIQSTNENDECGPTQLHRFVFKAGNLIKQEVIHTFSGKQPLFHSAEIRIIDNKYLISLDGAIFDLETKELFAEKVGAYQGRYGDKVYVNYLPHEQVDGLTYSFDLKTKKYGRHTQPNFYSVRLATRRSPDESKYLIYNYLSDTFVVFVRTGQHPSDFSSFRARINGLARIGGARGFDPPSTWLDNDRFITQRSNGDLVAFDTRSRTWLDVLLTLPIPKNLEHYPSMFRDFNDAIYYRADKLYRIDVDKKTYAETNEFGLGHGFVVSGRDANKLFIFRDKKLASFISRDFVATEKYLAAEFQDSVDAESPKGIRVWNEDVGTWTTMRIKYSPHLIGWLTN